MNWDLQNALNGRGTVCTFINVYYLFINPFYKCSWKSSTVPGIRTWSETQMTWLLASYNFNSRKYCRKYAQQHQELKGPLHYAKHSKAETGKITVDHRGKGWVFFKKLVKEDIDEEVVNLHCQLDWVQHHLYGDTFMETSLWRHVAGWGWGVSWEGKTHPECGWQSPGDCGPGLNKGDGERERLMSFRTHLSLLSNYRCHETSHFTSGCHSSLPWWTLPWSSFLVGTKA